MHETVTWVYHALGGGRNGGGGRQDRKSSLGGVGTWVVILNVYVYQLANSISILIWISFEFYHIVKVLRLTLFNKLVLASFVTSLVRAPR